MSRAQGSLLDRLRFPKRGPGGLHAPDCECAGCEQRGHTTQEAWDRAVAEEKRRKAEEDAARRARLVKDEKREAWKDDLNLAVKRSRERMQAEDARRARLASDPAVRRYFELRAEGKSISEAIATVDREFPGTTNQGSNRT